MPTGAADLTDVTSEHGGVSVTAASHSRATALSGAVAASFATGAESLAVSGSGAYSTNVIQNTITAAIQNGATVDARGTGTNGTITVSATDQAMIDAEVGTATAALGTAGLSVGVAGTNNTVANAVSASISAATVTTQGAAINVIAQSTDTITGYAAAISVSVSLLAEFPFLAAAGAGANSTSTDNNTISASIDNGADVTAMQGAVTVSVMETPSIVASTINVAVSAGVAIGGMTSTATVNSNISAYLGNNTTVNSASLTIQAQRLRSDLGPTARATVKRR
jgi:hypothetical protein